MSVDRFVSRASSTAQLTATVVVPAPPLAPKKTCVTEGCRAEACAVSRRAAVRRTSARRESAQGSRPAATTFVFFGAKGGAGTTTIAVNCGVEIARLSKRTTVIIDLKPGLGEVALFLGVRPRFSVLDAIDNLHRLDREFLKELVVKHKSGLEILAGSDHFHRPGAAEPPQHLGPRSSEAPLRQAVGHDRFELNRHREETVERIRRSPTTRHQLMNYLHHECAARRGAYARAGDNAG